MNFLVLRDAIATCRTRLRQLETQFERLPGLSYIDKAWYNYITYQGEDELDMAELLVAELLKRKIPYVRWEIEEIFAASGFEYDSSYIDRCNPDKDALPADFLKLLEKASIR